MLLTADARADGAARGVSLLDVEPELAEHVPEPDRPVARAVLRVSVVELRRGHAAELCVGPGALWLIVSGTIMQTTVVCGRGNAMVLGAGDLVRPPLADPAAGCVSFAVERASAVARLDARFRAAAQRWPGLALFVEERLADQAHRSAMHAATCTLPRVQDRILAVMCQVAERWGRVRPDGVYVDLDVSHRRLGAMVGAQRPTVTLALQELAAERRLRRVDGGWLLAHDAADGLVHAEVLASAAFAR